MPCVAIVQAAPTPFDLDATLKRALQGIDDAADAGADIAVFGETWLGTYSVWIDAWPEFGMWDRPKVAKLHARYRHGSITVPGPQTEQIGAAAAARGLTVVIGASERVEAGPGRGTLYNALLTFDETGALVNHHRKLVPTHAERLVWGPGDATGLRAAATNAGRVGGLVCWEHWMPLARQAMHESGEDVHVAVWPSVNRVHQLASRHYAFEGRCFVAAAGSILHRDALDRSLVDEFVDVDPTGFLLRGGSVIYGPDGEPMNDPVFDEECIIVKTLDLERVHEASLTLDVTGHYHRPDVLRLEVERRRPK